MDRFALSTIVSRLRRPQTWSQLSPDDFESFVIESCLLYGLEAPKWKQELIDLYTLACERLPQPERLAVLGRVTSLVASLHRSTPPRDRFGLVNALAPFIGLDPDMQIVSTAALDLASLLPAWQGDSLAGPRHVIALLADEDDQLRQSALVAALLALGDRRVVPLLNDHWARVDPASPSAVGSFTLVTAAEGAIYWTAAHANAERDDALGVLVLALQRLGEQASSHGLLEYERAFPVTDATEEHAVRIRRTWTAQDLVPLVRSHVLPASRTEAYPRLLPKALRAWGVEDEAFIESLSAAVPGDAPVGTLWTKPVELEVLPDWDRPDTLLEWCIVNPFGPTLKQLLRTRLPGTATDAIVLVQHHFLEQYARVVAVLPEDAAVDDLRKIVRAIFASNGAQSFDIVHSLPTSVTVRSDGLRCATYVAGLFQSAHAAAVRAGLTIADRVENPDAYVAWYHSASDPTHTAAERVRFLTAWSEATRAFNGGAGRLGE